MSSPATTVGSAAPVVAPPRKKVETPYPVVSASQVTQYDPGSSGCHRKWGFARLLKLETSKGAAAALGDDVDTGQLQPYLTEGKPIDFARVSGDIAASGLKYLPEPKAPGLECQRHFVMPTFTGPGAGTDNARFGYQGYLDMWSPDSSIMPGLLPHPPGLLVPLVGDFKTTGNWKWRKLAEALKTDVQATLYAKWATWYLNVNVVDLAWVYMRTKGGLKSERSYLRTNKDIIEPAFANIESIANEMFDVRAAAPPYHQTVGDLVERDDPETQTKAWADLMPYRNRARVAVNPKVVEYIETLEPNLQCCDAFGGCPFKANCNLSPDIIVDGLVASDMRRISPKPDLETDTNMPTAATSPFLAKLNAKKAAADAAPAAPPVTGINPPERELPPADPIGAVPIPDMPVAETTLPKKGRPKGSKNATKAAPAESTPEPLIELVTFGSDKAPSEEGMQFPCTWAEERYSDYGTGYGVGPFTITGTVRKGETYEQAYERTHERLGVLAAKALLKQKASFDAGLAESGMKRAA